MRWVLLAVLVLCGGCPSKRSPDAGVPSYRKVDVHVHLSPGAGARLIALMDQRGLAEVVNLSGGWPGAGLEQSVAEARRYPGRVVVFANPPLSVLSRGGTVAELVADLPRVKQLGARGLKFFKALGLGFTDERGQLLAVDDPRLDPFFEEAGRLGLPIAIHTGDPVAFWQPVSSTNERFDELTVHPRWSYVGRAVPTWDELFAQYERRVARHPHTTFIGVHFGNAPEAPERVAAMLEKYPNLWVDTAARVPELGRHDPAAMRALFVKYQDRILFGTDLAVGTAPEDLVLGSAGAEPPTAAEVDRFFSATWRYFETSDRGFPHPTPIQGRWTIDGLGLPPEVLRKVYGGNADRLLGER